MYDLNVRRLLVGKPIATQDAGHQRLGKFKALAVFSSDALSSSAYATEAILLVLILAGAGALGLSWPIALGIALLLIIVAFSYFQTIHAYPNGGGAYIVSAENLGKTPGLVAAAALLIDYILTVAVSVSAGVAALTSAFPLLFPLRIALALGIVAFITWMNLRGVRESGTFFSIPTYAFIVGVMAMIGLGFVRVISGDVPTAEESGLILESTQHATGNLTLFILFRAFAAGCTALTGVEAISNGIPAFKTPESRNAGQTLIIMVTILCVLFVGITFLANHFPIAVGEEVGATVLSQLARQVFGGENVFYYYLQFATLFILSLAANTAFADFPRLASLIARDRYLPRQLTNVGDRLVYTNGILALAVVASGLIILFDAREHNLLPLYAVGVFISFTLSQTGMVVHWMRERRRDSATADRGWYVKIGLNAFGALCTFVVMIVLMVTKFAEGAWIVMLAIPLLMAIFQRIHDHYDEVARCLSLEGLTPRPLVDTHPDKSDVTTVVLMNSLNRASLQALEYAMRLSRNVRVVVVATEDEVVARLRARWAQWGLMEVPLDVVPSPYREIGQPLIQYLHRIDAEHSNEAMPTIVVVPLFVVDSWWERLLHNQTTNAIREALHLDEIERARGRAIIDVPYRISDELYEPGTLQEPVIPSAGGEQTAPD